MCHIFKQKVWNFHKDLKKEKNILIYPAKSNNRLYLTLALHFLKPLLCTGRR